MAELCTDNIFMLIEKYKKKLIDSTNIKISPDEMAVLDNILFRIWQIGWLDKLEQPTVKPEHTCVTCGRTVNNGGRYKDGKTRCPIEEHYALPRDGYCHLWVKRKVWEDDYPEKQRNE